MERLPDELLLMILRRLSATALLRAARVCRRWAELAARDALLLRSRGDEARAHAALRVLVVMAPFPSLPAPLLAARHLRHLTAHAEAPLDARALAALAQLRHLGHLDVFLCARVLDVTALPALRRLHTLVLNETPTPGVLRALAGGPLRSLHMYGRAFYYEPRDLRALLHAQRSRLRSLTLRCAELRDRHYAAIGACENLHSLRLYSCWALTPAGAAHLTRLPRLRRLHVTGARMLRPRALAELLRQMPPGLHELALSASWFGDEHAPLLAARVPALRSLELWRCPLSAAGAVGLVAALAELRDFDSDVQLAAAHVSALAAHAGLQRLRALLPPSGGALRPGLRVRAADARLCRRYLRGGGEGFRAEIFYFLSRNLELPELSHDAPPLLFEADDDSAGDAAAAPLTPDPL